MRGWLKQLRTENRLTQVQIAKEVGIAQNSYANIENGTRRPSVKVAKKIATILGFDWTKFFDE